MSEIKLNLLDSHSLLIATVHGSVGDRLVAALSAEPETIDELEAALKRFEKCDSIPASSLNRKQRGPIDDQPWDAGILVIDLAARIVACESTYSLPSPYGRVDYHNGCHSTSFPLAYALSDEWYFAPTIENYQHHSDRRMKARAETPAIDTRSILYGKPLLEFIVENVQLLDTTTKREDTDHRESVRDIHRRWLMTPRDDLNSKSVRDVLFEKRELIDYDLESRMLQWSFFLEEPPSLSKESHAYRFAGYGTHEWVMYYNLVRHLIWDAVELKLELAKHARHLLSSSCCRAKSVIVLNNQVFPTTLTAIKRHQCPTRFSLSSSPIDVSLASVDSHSNDDTVPSQIEAPYSDWRRQQDPSLLIRDKAMMSFKNKFQPTNAELIIYLAEQQAYWLTTPNHKLDGYIPAEVINNERRRRPEAMTGRSMVVDEDCYCCKMMGDESEAGLGIYFCHFDGCNMEDEFAFSSHATLEEWKEHQRVFEQRSRKSASSNFDIDDCDIPF